MLFFNGYIWSNNRRIYIFKKTIQSKNIIVTLKQFFWSNNNHRKRIFWIKYYQNRLYEEKRHSLSFVFGYTHIPGAKQDGKTEEDVFLPTLGLDYLYEFRKKWFIGAAFDVELGKYEIDYEDDEISREIAVVFSGLVGYDVLPGWAVLAGPGKE